MDPLEKGFFIDTGTGPALSREAIEPFREIGLYGGIFLKKCSDLNIPTLT